jgi:hypothetical protein
VALLRSLLAEGTRAAPDVAARQRDYLLHTDAAMTLAETLPARVSATAPPPPPAAPLGPRKRARPDPADDAVGGSSSGGGGIAGIGLGGWMGTLTVMHGGRAVRRPPIPANPLRVNSMAVPNVRTYTIVPPGRPAQTSPSGPASTSGNVRTGIPTASAASGPTPAAPP